MNQTKIIEQLKSGKQERAFTQLYRYYPKIEKHIIINSGSKEEALDIFQEGLIVLFNKAKTITKNDNVQIGGFLINTCKLLWSNELRKKNVRKGSGDTALKDLAYQDEIENQLIKESRFKIIDEVLKQLGEKCKNILAAFYYKQLSMDAIAKKFGYKSVQSAKTQKFKCMESARELSKAIENQNLNLKN
ncbi:RNA polymerase sigma factor [Crocinitomix catalasitica]|uniref:RNA polymerase sigma factor n=1 Tax=Crocinitomix catalasitica TaxID=184607 RepID=UPI000482C6DC|nr:sigma-70 family RNA polymerase sigma factor [Crocinitomix catalasitica]